MSNPFIKRTVMTSRERANVLEARTLMSNLNTRDPNYQNKHITMRDNKLVKCINYEMLLKYVKGFYQLEDTCDDLSYHVQSISEGRYSYIDFDELNYLVFSGYDNTNPIYVIDPNAQKKGLLWIKGQIFPTVRERIIKFPIPVQKTFICNLPKINLADSIEFRSHVSDISNADISGAGSELRTHRHFLPIHGQVSTYVHDPTDISSIDVSGTDISYTVTFTDQHPNPFEEFAADIYNNTMTLFPTIPKSSVIRGTVNATGNVVANGGTFGGFYSGAVSSEITNKNRNCDTERKFDTMTGQDLNWTGKQCITCTSFENHEGLFDVSGVYDPSGVNIDFNQIIDKINPIVHSASIDMSGTTPILSFISSEAGTIDLSGLTSTETEAVGFPTINRIPLTNLTSGDDISNCAISVVDEALNTSLPCEIERFVIP